MAESSYDHVAGLIPVLMLFLEPHTSSSGCFYNKPKTNSSFNEIQSLLIEHLEYVDE